MTASGPPRAILFLAVSTLAQAASDRESLPEQERALRETAARLDWRVVDTILIPGLSRRYFTYDEFCAAAEARHILDPRRMFDHWERGDFDVLAAVTFSRLGREQSIVAEVINRTVQQAHARAYAIQGGWIDESNHRPMAAFAGMASATEDDEIRRRYRFGMAARVRKGLHPNRVPSTHIAIRDARGRVLEYVVDESKRRLFDDIWEALVVRRGRIQGMERVLIERGHAMGRNTVDTWVRNPFIWGHQALSRRRLDRAAGWAWVFDEAVPVPPGVLIVRNTHPAVWTGEQGESIKAELTRRIKTALRRRGPDGAYLFTGLMRCARCGRPFYATHERYRSGEVNRWYCASIDNTRAPRCGNRPVREDALTADLNALLDAVERTGALPARRPDQARQRAARAIALGREIDAATSQADRLIALQMTAPPALLDRYQAQVEAVAVRLDALIAERDRLEAEVRPVPGQAQAAELLRVGGRAWFWTRPAPEQNQLLAALLGGLHLIVADGRIVDVR